jgi:hypothetical protein
MNALGRYILASTLFLCATLAAVFAGLVSKRDYDSFLGIVALLTFFGAMRTLYAAMHAEKQKPKHD